MDRVVHDCVDEQNGPVTGWMILCPACGNGHRFDRGRWTFNGDYQRPTFSSSMLVRCSSWQNVEEGGWLTYHTDGTRSYRIPLSVLGGQCEPTVEAVAAKLGLVPTLEAVSAWTRELLEGMPPSVCHSFVENGQIRYLGDCTHEFAGKTVTLEAW